MESGFSFGESGSGDAQALAVDPLVLVVSLRSGERLAASHESDDQAARARLEDVQRALGGEPFVRVGDDLVLRTEEVRAVELVRRSLLGGPPLEQHRSTPTDDPAAVSSRVSRRGQPTPVDRARNVLLESVGALPTAEFVVAALGVTAVLVAALVTDDLAAGGAWLVVGLILGAYIVSRGISKAGTEGRGQR